MVIVNADDLGRSRRETEAAIHLYEKGRITCMNVMVFMEDSERAAEMMTEMRIDPGLHLNFSQRFTGSVREALLLKYHDRLIRFLNASKYSLVIYNPFLRRAFRYVFDAQINEFQRLFGKPPSHFTGHQHMHLCSNMLFDGIIRKGEKVRRSFSFWPGEKGLINRAYRTAVDKRISAWYVTTDYFFDLTQEYEKDHLLRVSSLARSKILELMTHPARETDYGFLMSKDYASRILLHEIGSYSSLS